MGYQVLFSLLINTRSHPLPRDWCSVIISNYQRILCFSFSWRDYHLYIYHLSAWPSFSPLHNSFSHLVVPHLVFLLWQVVVFDYSYHHFTPCAFFASTLTRGLFTWVGMTANLHRSPGIFPGFGLIIILLNTLADLNNVVVWMVSIFPMIFNDYFLFQVLETETRLTLCPSDILPRTIIILCVTEGIFKVCYRLPKISIHFEELCAYAYVAAGVFSLECSNHWEELCYICDNWG